MVNTGWAEIVARLFIRQSSERYRSTTTFKHAFLNSTSETINPLVSLTVNESPSFVNIKKECIYQQQSLSLM